MYNSKSKKLLHSNFYETDVAYRGTTSHNGKQRIGTYKQTF